MRVVRSYVTSWVLLLILFVFVVALAPPTGGVNIVIIFLAFLWCYRGALARAFAGRGSPARNESPRALSFREARRRMTPAGRIEP